MPEPTNACYDFAEADFDPHVIPDQDNDLYSEADIAAFEKALNTPEVSPIVALNDWKPIRQRLRRRKKPKRKQQSERTRDETREGFLYEVFRWPFLLGTFGWIILLGLLYAMTRLYIWVYEWLVTWRGERQTLRQALQSKKNYGDWKQAAQKLDAYLGNDKWKDSDEYAYYDQATVRTVKEQLKASRTNAKLEEEGSVSTAKDSALHLRSLILDCVKNNFVGVENARLYSETYYGTKNLAQEYIDELHLSLSFLLSSKNLTNEEKSSLAKQLHTNFGRSALCLSGGAAFAYYHFGVAKALLDASLLPEVITGTSGGALVAAMLCTRTDEELHQMLVPALASRIKACSEPFTTWFPRWRRTGARFDSLLWAKHCSWICRGSTTFREAYERTGRILNVTCVPSDPHSPTILCNHLTAPDCVIWSAVLASAAVPQILNPVVLMTKSRKDGSLSPYSFGHKWKDGSLRTDIPLKALSLHFNANFSIVSQVNPHINLFFFFPRGAVGRPVTHRKGRGWRGGYFGSAAETYLKLDMTKWLKILKHLELLPRPFGQDWSGIWLQRFEGTVTIWPKSVLSDYWYILSDPTMERLARMIRVGEKSAFPRLLFIRNRMKIERLIEEGLLLGKEGREGAVAGVMDEGPDANGDVIGNGGLRQRALKRTKGRAEALDDADGADENTDDDDDDDDDDDGDDHNHHLTNWDGNGSKFAIPRPRRGRQQQPGGGGGKVRGGFQRHSTAFEELKRQSGIFFDDTEESEGSVTALEDEAGVGGSRRE